MTWGCAQIDETEAYDGPAVTPVHRTDFEDMLQGLQHPMSNRFRLSAWALFTKLYSERKLTYETDTFPAISGIVQRIQQNTGDTYHAGLWRRHFLEGLLWYLEGDFVSRKENVGKPGVTRRREGWVAPSWSWASITGNISYPFTGLSSGYCARLEECSTTLSGLDPFGALTAGFARVTGPVTEIRDVAEDEAPSCHRQCMITLADGTQNKAAIRFDFVWYKSCSALMITPNLGLCIKNVEETADTYCRIGVITVARAPGGDQSGRRQLPHLTASDYSPPRTITLV